MNKHYYESQVRSLDHLFRAESFCACVSGCAELLELAIKDLLNRFPEIAESDPKGLEQPGSAPVTELDRLMALCNDSRFFEKMGPQIKSELRRLPLVDW